MSFVSNDAKRQFPEPSVVGDTARYLSWDRVLGENCQQGQASFFLNGLVHFDSDVQPVPIPAAAWLFGSGIAGIAALVRRRNTH